MLTGCGGGQTGGNYTSNDKARAAADSLMGQAMAAADAGRMLVLADSLEAAGAFSPTAANYYRGAAYCLEQNVVQANVYLRKATENPDPAPEDLKVYLSASTLLAQNLLEANFESALRQALPLMALMDSLPDATTYSDRVRVAKVIASSQIHLEQVDEANKNYDRLYGYIREWLDADTAGADNHKILAAMFNVASDYLDGQHFQKALLFTQRTDSVWHVCSKRSAADEADMEFFRGAIDQNFARAYQGIGKNKDAGAAYARYLTSPFARHDIGRVNATYYLLAAGRYAEAADNLRELDRIIEEMGYDLSLENIATLFIPKLQANLGAGRRDSALAVAARIAEIFDAAYTDQKRDDAAQLSTIYETQEKEQRVREVEAEMKRVRYRTMNIGLAVLTVVVLIFLVYKYRQGRKLKEKNVQLQQAYDQLEAATTAKERMESELRIARKIQMSMVPSEVPDIEGLDIYASMNPAKEVGGDLYNYMQVGDKLYFCIGDVSGKGVPASLFMAMATRGFRTLAAMGRTPAEIATRMNIELTENNEEGMFVTMFICCLDLKTGRLEYCNAGHNPPLVGNADGQPAFLDVLPNAPIGLWPSLEYEGEESESFRGRLMLLYTDGLNEAENRQQEQYGEERIVAFLAEHAFQDNRQLIETMREDVEAFRDGAEPNDDLSMLAVKFG